MSPDQVKKKLEKIKNLRKKLDTQEEEIIKKCPHDWIKKDMCFAFQSIMWKCTICGTQEYRGMYLGKPS